MIECDTFEIFEAFAASEVVITSCPNVSGDYASGDAINFEVQVENRNGQAALVEVAWQADGSTLTTASGTVEAEGSKTLARSYVLESGDGGEISVEFISVTEA